MEYIEQLLKEKEAEAKELTKDLELLMKENIKLSEELSVVKKVLENYHDEILKKDLKIQTLENNSAAWLTTL